MHDVAERVTSATGKKYVHLSNWMAKVTGLWVVLKYCLARLVWTCTPKLSILLLKEAYTMMLLGVCTASIHLLHEHSPLHCHLSSVALVRRQCFGRCCFCTVFNWRLQTATENLQIYFPWICEHFPQVSFEYLSVLHWSISVSAVIDLPETTWCPGRAAKRFLSRWQKTQQPSKSA